MPALRSLPEVADINPRRFSTDISDESLLSFVPMKAVEEESGRLDALQTKRWSEVKKGYTPFQDGDVVFAKITPCMENGKYALASGLHGGRAAGSTEFHVFRPKSDLDPKYLLFFLFSPELRREAKRSMRGAAGQLRVPPIFFQKLYIPVPPLDEQERIVAEIEKQFTRLDAGVSSLKRVQSELKSYRASVLKAACEGRLVPTEAELAGKKNRSYETGEQLLERILKERRQKWKGKGKYKQPIGLENGNLPQIPDGWIYAKVEQLGNVQLGRQRSPKNVSKNFPTKYIRAANITEQGIDVSDVLEMEFTPIERERFALREGDVVLSEASGSASQVGKPAIWHDELPLCCFQNTVIRFRATILDVRYALLVFRHFYVNKVFAKIAGGVGINHLGADKFSTIPFPVAPLAEQQRIVAEVERRLSVIEDLEAIADANLQRASRLRQSILHRAFSGDL